MVDRYVACNAHAVVVVVTDAAVAVAHVPLSVSSRTRPGCLESMAGYWTIVECLSALTPKMCLALAMPMAPRGLLVQSVMPRASGPLLPACTYSGMAWN